MPTTRSLTYEFKAKFDSLRGGLVAAGKSVDDFGKKLTGLDARGEKMRRGLTDVGSTAGKIGFAAAAGLTAIVGVTANFEKAMSSVAAATGEAEDGMEALREAAIEAGAETAFSASEAAGGIEALGKAGVTTEDILAGGLQGALDLAAAGGLEVADAAEAAASAMAQFGLSGEDVPHIADLLAAAAGKAQGEVSDMAQALNQSGIIADQTGLTIEETTGALAAFAEKGLLGSDAGTSFKTMLGALTPNSEKAATAMEELGISAYDSQGNFVGLTEFAGSLKDGLAGLTEEQRAAKLEIIFGSDAVRAASILYEQGADGVQSWIDKVDDSGFAAEQAEKKLDNLAGDLDALKGSLETALIGMGEGSQGPLRKLVQGLTDAINAFNNMPSIVQNSVTGILAATAVLGGGLWATSKVINGIASTKQALEDLGVEAGKTRGILGGLAKAGAGLAAFEAVALALDQLHAQLETPIDTSTISRDLEALTGGRVTDNLQDMSIWLDDIQRKWERDWNPIARLSPLDMSGFEDAERGLGAIDQELAQLVESGNADQAAASFAEIQEQAKEAGLSGNDLIDIFAEYRTALQGAGLEVPNLNWAAQVAIDARDALGPTEDLAGATEGLGAAAEDAGPSLRDLTEAMLDQANAAVDAFDAVTSYRQALKDAKEQADKNDAGIEGSSKKALENRDALSGLASAWNNQSAAVRNNIEKFREARETFIETATAMGVPIKEAEKLADRLLAIPRSRVAKINLEGIDPAITKANELRAAILDIPLTRTVEVTFERHGIGLDRLTSHAQGGLISGPGTGTSDSIPAYVSRGEYVVRAAAVEKYGVAMFDRLNAMRFAAGGPVPSALPVGGGGVAIDYDRLAGAMLRARPLYGNVHITGDPTAFKRELAADARRASLGGFS